MCTFVSMFVCQACVNSNIVTIVCNTHDVRKTIISGFIYNDLAKNLHWHTPKTFHCFKLYSN